MRSIIVCCIIVYMCIVLYCSRAEERLFLAEHRRIINKSINQNQIKVSLLLNMSLSIRPLTFINEALRISGSPFAASTASP